MSISLLRPFTWTTWHWDGTSRCIAMISLHPSLALLQNLESHFAPSYYDDPQGALFKLTQCGTINEYLTMFKKPSCFIWLALFLPHLRELTRSSSSTTRVSPSSNDLGHASRGQDQRSSSSHPQHAILLLPYFYCHQSIFAFPHVSESPPQTHLLNGNCFSSRGGFMLSLWWEMNHRSSMQGSHSSSHHWWWWKTQKSYFP